MPVARRGTAAVVVGKRVNVAGWKKLAVKRQRDEVNNKRSMRDCLHQGRQQLLLSLCLTDVKRKRKEQ